MAIRTEALQCPSWCSGDHAGWDDHYSPMLATVSAVEGLHDRPVNAEIYARHPVGEPLAIVVGGFEDVPELAFAPSEAMKLRDALTQALEAVAAG